MLKDTLPEDAIDPAWIGTYQETIDVIWWQLVRLNSNIYALEKLLGFPFTLFVGPISHGFFWELTKNALFDSCVLIIWKVGVDTDRRGITLSKFQEELRLNIRNEYRAEFEKALDDVDFHKTFSTFKSKVREIRHNYVAHLNLDKHIKPSPQDIKARTLLFDELKNCRDILNRCFEVLCIGHQKALLPIDYHPDVTHPAGTDSRSDIERLLDGVARNSDILNLPETYPDNWVTIFRNQLSPEELAILNEYRKKFGMVTLA